jgi:hypothetical protein
MNFTPQQVWLAIEPVDTSVATASSCWYGTAPASGWRRRRLHRGRFTWPQAGEAVCTLSAEQWRWLATGVDWQRLSAQAPSRWKL